MRTISPWMHMWLFLGLFSAVLVHCAELGVEATLAPWQNGTQRYCSATQANCERRADGRVLVYKPTYAVSPGQWAPDGDWRNGTGRFQDPLPSGALAVGVQALVYGLLDCTPSWHTAGSDREPMRSQNTRVVVSLNGQLVQDQVLEQTHCADQCLNCVATYMFSSAQTWNGSSYVYGGLNEFSLTAINDNDASVVLSQVQLTLFYLVAPTGDGDSDSGLSAEDFLIGGIGVGVSVVAVALLGVCCVTPLLVKQKNVKNFLQRHVARVSGVESRLLSDSDDEESDPILLWTKMSDERKQMAITELEIGEMIGKGSYGEVYKAYWMDTVVAVKKLPAQITGRLDTALDREAYEFLMDFKREAAIMKSLRHPNILQILATYLDPPNLCMVTEYMAKGSLYAILHGPDDLSWKRVCQILLDAARGISYLHNLSPVIIHRDLKSQNLLIDESWRCKVSDFGLAKMMGTRTLQTMTSCGTPCWTAPEVLRNERYSEKADVFSFGVVMWECITRENPHDGLDPFKVIFAVGTQGLRLDLPQNCHPDVSVLMQRCWSEDPDARPPFRDIIQALLRLADLDFPIPARTPNSSGLLIESISQDDRWLIDHIKLGLADNSAVAPNSSDD